MWNNITIVMYYFKGSYLGRILNSGFVLTSKSSSFIIDPTVRVFEDKWIYRNDLLEKLIEYLEVMPRPFYVFITHEHEDHADTKVLEILQRHFSAKIYVPVGIRNSISKSSPFLIDLQAINAGDIIKVGGFKIRVFKGGDTINALSYSVEAWKKTIYFAGDKYSEWPSITVDYLVIPLWLYERMRKNFREVLKTIKFEKIIWSHFNSKYYKAIIEEIEKEIGEKSIILDEFSDLIIL